MPETLNGRELDIAVAERVMQWPRRDHDDDVDYPDTYFSAHNDGGQIVVFRGGSQRAGVREIGPQVKSTKRLIL